MTRPISCPPCLPNVWVRKGDGIDPTSRLCRSGSGSVIDIAISPQQATISALLSHVRKADIVGVSSLRRGVAEAIEAVAHGDESTSRVVGRVIDEIKLPPGTIIGAVVRGNDVMIANDNLRIEQGDHVIMFLTDKSLLPTSKDSSSQVLSSCN